MSVENRSLRQARPGEKLMKEWAWEQMERCGIGREAVAMRLKRGHYEGQIAIRRVNLRIVFVVETGQLKLDL